MTVMRVYEVVKAHGHYTVGDIRTGPADSASLAQAVRAGLIKPVAVPELSKPVKKFKRIRDMKTAGELKGDGTSGL